MTPLHKRLEEIEEQLEQMEGESPETTTGQQIKLLLEVVRVAESALRAIIAHEGMCMMGPTQDICDEVIERSGSSEDLIEAGFQIGSHQAYADCVVETRAALDQINKLCGQTNKGEK